MSLLMTRSAARDGGSGTVAESRTCDTPQQHAAQPGGPVADCAAVDTAECPGGLRAAEPDSATAPMPAEDSIIQQFLQCMQGPLS